MKKKTKVIAITAVILVIALVALVIYIAIPKKAVDYSLLSKKVTDLPEYVDSSLGSDNIVELGEQNGIKLSFKRDTSAFLISNTATGAAFTSGVNPAHYVSSGDIAADQSMYTVCQVGYTDFNGLEDVFNPTTTACDIKEKALKNGIALELDFTEFEISFTVEVWLNDQGVKARIPAKTIKEKGKFGITSITLFPMMGAVKNNEDGFIVFPDGSGSLYKFGKSQNTSPVSTFCYFQNSFDIDEVNERINQGQYNVMIPAFSITDGKTGVVSYVTDGDENTYITLQPAFSAAGQNRITASCMYRKSYSYISPSDVEITEVEKEFSAGDFGIQYFFIDNSARNITYGDMATVVREYMLRKGLLNKDAASNDIKANLQLVMAAKGNSGMDKSLKALTEFNQVEKIISAVNEENRDNLRVYMLGWQKGGYGLNPAGDKIASLLGSKKDLINLNNYLSNNKIESYMVADYIYAIKSGVNFNANAQAVYNEKNLPITDGAYESYLRNGLVELETFINKRLPYLKDVKANGIAFEKAGYYLYDDYSKGGRLTRMQNALSFAEAAKRANKDGLKTAVQGGNAYMLSSVDAIYDMPEKSSENTQMAYSIPFYQMIVHGSVPYTGNVAGNMAADFEQQKLKWIEYGSQPNFVLTYNTSELLKNTYADVAFATDYEEHIDSVNECIEEFNTKLQFTAKETIIDHKVISDDISAVTYESGKTIYINYSEQAVNVNGTEISAEDYVIVEGGSAQ